jgi:hypothetical protein
MGMKQTPGRLTAQAGQQVDADRLNAIEAAGATPTAIVKVLSSIAFSSIGDYFKVTPDGRLQARPLKSISKTKLMALRKARQTETRTGAAITTRIEYELYDKVRALNCLCRLRGDVPTQHHQLSGKNGGSIKLIVQHSVAGKAARPIIRPQISFFRAAPKKRAGWPIRKASMARCILTRQGSTPRWHRPGTRESLTDRFRSVLSRRCCAR